MLGPDQDYFLNSRVIGGSRALAGKPPERAAVAIVQAKTRADLRLDLCLVAYGLTRGQSTIAVIIDAA